MTNRSPGQMRNCLLASFAYLLTTWACVWLLRHPLGDAATWLRAVVSLAPILPISFAIRAVVRMMLAGDELQRRIDLEAIAVSSVAVGLASLTLSLLIKAQVLTLSGTSALLWVFPALWLGYGFAKLWAARRY